MLGIESQRYRVKIRKRLKQQHSSEHQNEGQHCLYDYQRLDQTRLSETCCRANLPKSLEWMIHNTGCFEGRQQCKQNGAEQADKEGEFQNVSVNPEFCTQRKARWNAEDDEGNGFFSQDRSKHTTSNREQKALHDKASNEAKPVGTKGDAH